MTLMAVALAGWMNRELCAGLLSGEIVVFDKAYVDFPHLCEPAARGVQDGEGHQAGGAGLDSPPSLLKSRVAELVFSHGARTHGTY